ncbi:unnamed protein product [Calypogeia fissa]
MLVHGENVDSLVGKCNIAYRTRKPSDEDRVVYLRSMTGPGKPCMSPQKSTHARWREALANTQYAFVNA